MHLSKDNLWDGTQIHVPPDLRDAYRMVLERHGWQPHFKRGSVGGATELEAQVHFKSNFQGSACRLVGLAHDPLERCSSVPEELQQVFSTGKLRILDLVCGAGSASLGLLATVAARRRSLMDDCSPLNVSIQAADFNPECLRLFRAMATQIEPSLAATGIAMQHQTTEWDATNALDTHKLMDAFVGSHADHDALVLVSAISGSAGSKSTYENFRTSFEYLKLRTTTIGTLLWIEPGNSNEGGWLLRLISKFYSKHGINNQQDISTFYKWHEPFAGGTHHCDIGAILVPHRAGQ